MEVGKLVMTPQQQVKAEGEERADCPERREINEKYNKGIVNGIWGWCDEGRGEEGEWEGKIRAHPEVSNLSECVMTVVSAALNLPDYI